MKFIVLGGYGIIGRAVAADLFRYAGNAEIIVAGRNRRKAKLFASSFRSKRVKGIEIDISKKENLSALLRKSDACANCLQYYFNLEIMHACLQVKTNYVDLGGMFHNTKKQLLFDRAFKNIGKTAILGMGSAPGISNVLAGFGAKFLNKILDLEIVFADRDDTRYKQPFVLPYSFKTLVDEYIMKPAIFHNGKIVFTETHSGLKKYDFGREFGKQEGFLTLHSEIATLPSSLKEKGIKHCEFRVTFPREFNETMLSLIQLGFASQEKLIFNSYKIKTIDITSDIMDNFLPRLGTRIRDKELMRVIFNNGKIVLDAITESDGKTSAGVLDTGIPCSIAAQMLASKIIVKSGVYPPENIIPFEKFFKELRKRKIKILKNGRVIN